MFDFYYFKYTVYRNVAPVISVTNSNTTGSAFGSTNQNVLDISVNMQFLSHFKSSFRDLEEFLKCLF